VDGPGEPALDHVPQDAAADRRLGARPEDGDGARREEAFEGVQSQALA
jgi:hypothetical protein